MHFVHNSHFALYTTEIKRINYLFCEEVQSLKFYIFTVNEKTGAGLVTIKPKDSHETAYGDYQLKMTDSVYAVCAEGGNKPGTRG